MSTQSIPDRFVAVMAEIRSMEPDGDDPMRYVIWQLQDKAFQALADSISLASGLAISAKMLQRDYKESLKELARDKEEAKS